MKALILCGGAGTRLRPVIGETQKAVAQIEGRPFLQYVVEQLERAGLHELVFCTHYQSEQVQEALRALPSDPRRSLRVVREPEPFGTGGAILYALHELNYRGALVALNADTYLDAAAYRMARETDAPALVVTSVADCSRFGAIVSNAEGRVERLVEKGVGGPGWISAGVYRLDGADLAGRAVRPCSMENDIIPEYIGHGHLRAIPYTGPFLDIGTPDSLRQLRELGVQELYPHGK